MDKDELRRLAKQTGFDLATLEKDYALTWLLSGIYAKESKLMDVLIFKGGTAIRKVYFPEWRLSEDLDFTVAQKMEPQNMKQDFEQVFQMLKESCITYSFSSFNHRGFAVFAEVKFLGPLGFRNKITLDISLKEKMVEQPERIIVKPEYKDIPEFEMQVYSLNEILVEKIRSIFQRGKARDYYDAWRHKGRQVRPQQDQNAANPKVRDHRSRVQARSDIRRREAVRSQEVLDYRVGKTYEESPRF